jgi:hypothetical protein
VSVVLEVNDSHAVHFYHAKQIVEERFLVFWIRAVAAVKRHLTCANEQSKRILVVGNPVLKQLDKAISVLLKE